MKAQANVLLTGATGFVGHTLLGQLFERESYKVTAALRSANGFDCCQAYALGDFSQVADWSTALTNQQVVIHVLMAK